MEKMVKFRQKRMAGIAALLISSSSPTIALAQDIEGPATSDDTEDTDNIIIVRSVRESMARGRELERDAESLRDVISGNAIGKLPDSNVAEALARAPSVMLQPDQGEGRYVSIRGVDPILNNVTMNGQTIAVSDTDGRSGRAAPLDVLSASALNRVEIIKVTTPDMDGQSIGGTVNIVTPTAFDYDDAFIALNADIGYNDFGTESDIYSAGASLAQTFFNGTLGVFISGGYWYKEYLSQYYETQTPTEPASGGDGTLYPGRVIAASASGERERVNGTFNMEYRPTAGTTAWLRYYYTNYTDEGVRPEFLIRNRGDLVQTGPDEMHYTRYRIENDVRFERQERPVHQVVLGGEQVLGAWTIDGNLNYTTAKEVNPYLNFYEAETDTDTIDTTDPQAAPVYFVKNSDGFFEPVFNPAASSGLTPYDAAFHRVTQIRSTSSLVEEETFTADLNLAWEGELGGADATFKFGAKYLDRQKSVDDVDIRHRPTVALTLADGGLGTYLNAYGAGEDYGIFAVGNPVVPDGEGYAQFFTENPDLWEYNARASISNSIEDDYDLSERIFAAYAMGSIDIGSSFNLLGGVRIEVTDVDVAAFGFIDDVEQVGTIPEGRSRLDELPFVRNDVVSLYSEHNYTTVLPSAIATWDIASGWQLRASVSTNLGRPDYPDTAPISSLGVQEVYDEVADEVYLNASNEIGNPDLKPYFGLNFDASLAYYLPDGSGSLSVGAFYKKIDNAIYEFQQEFTNYTYEGILFDSYSETSLNNAESGHIAGVELSLQKELSMLPSPLDGFGVAANASFIESEVEVFQRPDESLPFFNQADTILNGQVYYEKGGFSARVAYSYQSDALDTVSSSPETDLYRDSYETVSARIAYEIADNFVISVTGNNLTDEPVRFKRGEFIGEGPGYERYGREFRLGISWTN